MTDILNAETIKQIVTSSSQAAAKEAVRTFVQDYPHLNAPPAKVEIPHSIKLAGGVVTALMTAAVIACCFWIVTTLNELQLTVRDISTRQQTDTSAKRLDAVEAVGTNLTERVIKLEGKPGR